LTEGKHLILRTIEGGNLVAEFRPCDALAVSGDGLWLAAVGTEHRRHEITTWILLIGGPRRYWVLRGPYDLDDAQRESWLEQLGHGKQLSPEIRRAIHDIRRFRQDLRTTLQEAGTDFAYEMKPVSLEGFTDYSWSYRPGGLSSMEEHGHPTAVGFSQNGRLLVIGRDRQVIVLRIPSEARSDVAISAWTPCGQYDVAGEVQSAVPSDDGERIYVLNSKGLIQSIECIAKTRSEEIAKPFVTFSKNGRWLAIKTPDESTTIVRLDYPSSTPATIKGEKRHHYGLVTGPRRAAIFSPDSKHLLCIGDEQLPILYELETARSRSMPKLGLPAAGHFSPDGQWLALAYSRPEHAGSEYRALRLFDMQSDRVVAFEEQPSIVEFSPLGNGFVIDWSEATHGASLVDIASLKVVLRYPVDGPDHYANVVNCLTHSPCGQVLAIGTWYDPRITLFAATTGTSIRTIPLSEACPLELAFSPCGFLLACVLGDRTLRLWSVPSGDSVAVMRLPGTPVSIAWSPTGQIIVVGLHEGGLFFFEPRNVRSGSPVVRAGRSFHLDEAGDGGNWQNDISASCPYCALDFEPSKNLIQCPACRRSLRLVFTAEPSHGTNKR
jgi:WD40 repeat protein